jgi:integrase/recombinase XerC
MGEGSETGEESRRIRPGTRYQLDPVMPSAIEFNDDLTKRFVRWLRIQEYTGDTNRHYLSSIVSLCRFLNDIPATDATHLDIRDFLASVAQRGVKRATIWRAMSALRCFFDFLNMGGLIAWSPPRFVRLPRLKRRVPRVLTENQMRMLAAAAGDLHERTMIEVLYGTGARAGEVRSMRVEDVDLGARRIRVLGKCGYRYVLFPRATSSFLRRYIGTRRSGYLFVCRSFPRKLHLFRGPSGSWRSYFYKYVPALKHTVRLGWRVSGKEHLTREQALRRLQRRIPKATSEMLIGRRPMGGTTVRYVVMRVGLKAGIHVNPQLIRHTFATHLLDHGADIRMIQKMLGHISVATTQTYTHVSMKQVQKVLEKCHPRNL